MPTTVTKMQFRRDTAANFASLNPTLSAGEPALETDTRKVKLGDGVTAYSGLPYWPPTLTTAEQAAIIAGKVRSGGTAAGAPIAFHVQATQPTAATLNDIWLW